MCPKASAIRLLHASPTQASSPAPRPHATGLCLFLLPSQVTPAFQLPVTSLSSVSGRMQHGFILFPFPFPFFKVVTLKTQKCALNGFCDIPGLLTLNHITVRCFVGANTLGSPKEMRNGTRKNHNILSNSPTACFLKDTWLMTNNRR